MKTRVGLSLLCVMLNGCAAVSGFPQPIMTERQENAEIAGYIATFAVADYDKCSDKVLCRNTIVDARLRAVDLAFYRFQRKIYSEDSRVSLGSNALTLVLSSAATVSGAGGVAAGAGLLTAGRDVFQKQLRSVSLPLLFDQMIAKRREVLLRIRLGQRLSPTAYTLFQALDDVSEYEVAGSLPAAAAELGASVGQSSRTAQIQLDALRATSLASAGVAAGVPTDAASTAAQSSSGTIVYASSSGSASVATVVPDPSSKTAPAPGSVIYTNQTGSGTAASVIPVPPPLAAPTNPTTSASPSAPTSPATPPATTSAPMIMRPVP